MSATNHNTVAKTVVENTISAAELAALGLQTANECKQIAQLTDQIKESSAVIFARYKDIFPMKMNFKTGLADIVGFCQSIYMTFPDADKRFPEGNPGKPYSWTTAGFKYGSKAASGLKAVDKWLHENIASLYINEVPEIDAETGQAKVDADGKPVVKAVPAFKADVKEDETKIAKVLAALQLLQDTDVILAEEKASFIPQLTAVALRLQPELQAKKAAHLAVVEARKAERVIDETTEETEAVVVAVAV
jgi:hypothetical protein